LETICEHCEKINHSGFWAHEQNILEIYEESKYGQNNIIRITRDLRNQGRPDEEIKEYLGLKRRVPWKEDRDYLTNLFGFVSSRRFERRPKPLLSEEEQRERLDERPAGES